MKVVINTCFGGYSLSEVAARRMAELGHQQAAAEIAEYDKHCTDFAEKGWWGESEDNYFSKRKPNWYGYIGDREDRADPILVQVVEEMGREASGSHARLEIVEIPDDVSWHIEEYDGNEHVAEDHRVWS